MITKGVDIEVQHLVIFYMDDTFDLAEKSGNPEAFDLSDNSDNLDNFDGC